MATSKEIKSKILSILISDSRKSYRTIANELGISTTTVSRIVKDLEDEGVILGYTTMVDWNKLGFDSTLCIQVNIAPEADTIEVGNKIKNINAIKQVFYTTGDTTFSAYAVCKNSQDAATVLEELRRVKGVEQVVGHTILKIF
ncbi:MAG: Lrp/AsnC family transcriptional regulator [Thermoplasmata archaeon]|nr:MAG: Lrp/AsnC family transcriptional regulator [Thermoplasmata archaeon]